ncbi:TonB-dependent receptor plug domain-containing protein [Vibrio campbellii]|uniref:TonB-dependent receptor plug domain-containing protein n=1 Tax=Vibrio campbellii TaxID=680 RepID=UPI00142D58D6|nr:TonB-dependent receptor [Vibrio campbellii]NIY88384.1 TonB-dependent receptor [Vibrio campbellii]
MYKKTTALSVAISLALGTAAVAPLAAQAEEQQVEKLQKMKVTGSHLTRQSIEGSTPIAVLDRADIERAGDISIADVIRKSPYNSFGSHNERSGSSAQSAATIDLRGLGDSRTLVLVNGKRLPGSASMGGGPANINIIPAAIVERVEIMADGGSAVYGSDAVAGVVNIILLDEFDGINITGGVGVPSQKGGDEKNISLVAGTVSDKGSFYFSLEHDSKDEIYQRDRDYLKATGTDTGDYFQMRNVSVYGRNVLYKGKYSPIAGATENGECKGDFITASLGSFGDACLYDYTSEASQTASLERNTLFVNSDLNLTDTTTFNAQVLVSRNESFGRYAPAAGWFRVDPTTDAGKQFFDDNGLTPEFNEEGDPALAQVRYRFNSVGTRDNSVTDFQTDIKLGLDGTSDTDLFGEVIWETGYHLNYSKSNEVGTGYVFRPAAEKLFNEGKFVDGEFTADAVDELSATTARENEMEMHQIYGGLQFDIAEVGDIVIPIYVGAEAVTYDFSDTYDSQSAADNIIGSSGNSGGGTRETFAFFAESLIPINEELEVNLAARYDHYSDFGDAFSPKASLRYQPQDNLLFRAGAGLGFRAPTLNNLYAADSRSADSAKDYISCAKEDISDADCPVIQYDVIRKSNEDLDAETSRSFNIGVSYSPIEDLSVGLDYYNIQIEDMISRETLQGMIDEERSSGTSNSNIVRESKENPNIFEAYSYWVNQGTLETSGLDLTLNYLYDFDIATVRYDFAGTYLLDYTAPEYVGGPSNNQVGRNGQPEYRFTTGVGLNVLSDHDVYLSADHIAGQAQDVDENYNKTGSIPSHTTFNIAYNYMAPWDGKLTAGVRNITDEAPAFESDGVTYNTYLYSIQGRVFFLKYSQNF